MMYRCINSFFFISKWQKNTSKHRIINRAPYEAVFGPIRCGVTSSSLPETCLQTVETEDELEAIVSQFNIDREDVETTEKSTELQTQLPTDRYNKLIFIIISLSQP